MKITLDFLRANHACRKAIIWFNSQQDSDLEIIIHKLMEEKNFPWVNWLILKTLNKEKIVKYAIFSAESVLDLYEKRFQDDKPRLAIEAAKECLINLSAAADIYAAFQSADAADTIAYNAASAEIYAAFHSAQADSDAAHDASAEIYAAFKSAQTAFDAADTIAYNAAAAAAGAASAAQAAVDDATYAGHAAAYAIDAAVAAANAAKKNLYVEILNYGISLIEKE